MVGGWRLGAGTGSYKPDLKNPATFQNKYISLRRVTTLHQKHSIQEAEHKQLCLSVSLSISKGHYCCFKQLTMTTNHL